MRTTKSIRLEYPFWIMLSCRRVARDGPGCLQLILRLDQSNIQVNKGPDQSDWSSLAANV